MHVGCGVSSCAAAALRASSGVIRSSRPSFQVSEDRSIEDGTAPQRIVSLIGRKKLADRNGITLGREPLADRTIMFADCRNRLSSTSFIMCYLKQIELSNVDHSTSHRVLLSLKQPVPVSTPVTFRQK